MKRRLIATAALLVSIAWLSPLASAQPGFSISFGDFYASLSPYGEWVYVDYGVYAWRPGRIVHGWTPYAYGRWVWSTYGWYWVSEEPWSWAVYHYGRWHYDDWYGWIWIPGYDWAPAWVEWRYGPDYVGWAPLGPYALWSRDRGIHYSQAYRAPYDHWTFVAHRSMTRPDVYRYRYRGEDVRRAYGSSRYTGSVRYRDGVVESRGPDREYVERRGNVRIGTAEVVDVNDYSRVRATREGERERIAVYRPQVNRSTIDRSARPDRVTRTERAPSIDSRYLDQRMRPEPDVQPADRRARQRQEVGPPAPGRTPSRESQPSDRRPRQEVGSPAPGRTTSRESQPAVKEPARQPRPDAPQNRQQQEPRPRDRD
jgi:hypothetical protein